MKTREITNDGIMYKDNRLLYLAVDFLPCELARDASKQKILFLIQFYTGIHFSSRLKEFLANVAFSDSTKPLEE